MDVEIQEVDATLTVMDLKAIKAEVIAAVMAHLAEERRLEKRREADRRVASGAAARPDGVA
jgi:hypothetical protein